MSCFSTDNRIRRGVTLIELLVVISIMGLIAAVALPMVNAGLEGRRVREASRMVNLALSAARARALSTGRPAGVLLRRLPGNPQAALTLERVEVPPPYAGDTEDARIRLERVQGSNSWDVKFDSGSADMWDTLVQSGDTLQLNFQGSHYRIEISGGNKLQIGLFDDDGQPPMLPEWILAQGLPFKVFRQPVKALSKPIELPATTVVDLGQSGIGMANKANVFKDGAFPVTIMFSPNGSVDDIYHNGKLWTATETIYLLIGRQDQVLIAPGNNDPDLMANSEDPNNMWITIRPRTGLISTAPVVEGDSRELAREQETVGGR